MYVSVADTSFQTTAVTLDTSDTVVFVSLHKHLTSCQSCLKLKNFVK